jgi:hypothetical protein
MLSDLDRFRAQFTRYHPALPAGIRNCHDLKFFRQQFEELPVQRAEKVLSSDVEGRFLLQACLHGPLYHDMGNTFQLQVALGRFGIVLLLHGPDDIVGMGVVPLYQVGVVAVDDAQQFAQGLQRYRMLPGAERR